MGYDRRFRQISASQPGRSWTSIDPTLWNLTFAGEVKTTWCTHCFSLSHTSDNCELSSKSKPQLVHSDRPPQTGQGTQHKLICFQWNKNASATYPYPNCRFQHISTYVPMILQLLMCLTKPYVHCPKHCGLSTSLTAPQSTSKGYKPKPLMQAWN